MTEQSNERVMGRSWDEFPEDGIVFHSGTGNGIEVGRDVEAVLAVNRASLYDNRVATEALEHRAAFHGGLGHAAMFED